MTDCLAATGASPIPLLVLVILVVVAGVAVTVLPRRRRRAAVLSVGVVLALLAGGFVAGAHAPSAQAAAVCSGSAGDGGATPDAGPEASPDASPDDPTGQEPDVGGTSGDTDHTINFRIDHGGPESLRVVVRRDGGGDENKCVRESSPVNDEHVFTSEGRSISGSMSYTSISSGSCNILPRMVKWQMTVFVDSTLVAERTLRAIDWSYLDQDWQFPFPLPTGLAIDHGRTRFVDDVADPNDPKILRTVTQSTGNDTDPIVFEFDRSQPFLQYNFFTLDADLDTSKVDRAGVGTWTWAVDVGDCVTSWDPVDPVSMPSDLRADPLPYPRALISATTRGPLRPLGCSEHTDPLIAQAFVQYQGPTGRTAIFRIWLDRRLKPDPPHEAWSYVALLNCEVVNPGQGFATCGDHTTEWIHLHDPIVIGSSDMRDDRSPLILTVR
jgi:hypothetical protein